MQSLSNDIISCNSCKCSLEDRILFPSLGSKTEKGENNGLRKEIVAFPGHGQLSQGPSLVIL